MQQAGNSGPVGSGYASNICFFTSELVMFTPVFYLVFHLLMRTMMPNYLPELLKRKKNSQRVIMPCKPLTKVVFMRE